MFLRSCWGPCFTVNQRNYLNLEKGAIIVALYTAFLHFLSLSYAAAILADTVRTDTFYSPLFEFSRPTTKWLAVLIIFYSIAFMLAGSWGLIHGVQSVRVLSLSRCVAGPHVSLTTMRTQVIRTDLNNESS